MASLGGDPLGELMSQLQHLQEQVAAVGSGPEGEVVGSAGGGAVRVRARGELEFTAVEIDPAVVDPAEVSVLEDLVLAALRDAAGKLRQAREQAVGQAMGGALSGLFGALAGSAWAEDLDDADDDDEDDEEDEDDPPVPGRGGLPAGGGTGDGETAAGAD